RYDISVPALTKDHEGNKIQYPIYKDDQYAVYSGRYQTWSLLQETPDTLLEKIALDVDFLWNEELVRLLTSSPGASATLNYSPGPSTPPSYSPGSSTPQSYSLGSSRNAETLNCKNLLDKITVLKATVEMYKHPKQHIVNSTALLHEIYNDMEKLDLE
nr:hypothetical protein [Tanacetum cinerariifolium]